jgi:hypothetical protein
LPPHATTAAVAVVVGATVARLLHHHKHRWLRLLQTLGSWSGLYPLPLIGQLTGRWSPRTVTPHHEVVKAARVLSMVGAHTLTQLHWRSGLHHGDMRGGGGRRRRRTTADLGHLRPIPRAADPSDGEEDCRSMRSTPRTTTPPALLTPSLTRLWRRCHHQVKPAYQDLVCHRM